MRNSQFSQKLTNIKKGADLPTRYAKSSDSNARLLENLLGAGIWTYDFNSRDVTWSPGLYKLIGLDPATVSASIQLYEALVHPDDRLNHHQIVTKATAGEMSNRRFRIIRPDGRLLWVESHTERVFDRSGAMVMLCGVIQEVTSTEKLRADKKRLSDINKSLVEIAGGEFWRTDPEVGSWTSAAGWISRGNLSISSRIMTNFRQYTPTTGTPSGEPGPRASTTRSKIEFSARVLRHDGVYQSSSAASCPSSTNVAISPNGMASHGW